MKVYQILEGKPFMTEFGIVGYSTVVLIQDAGKNIIYDCGPKGCALQLKEGLHKVGLSEDDITHVVISHMHFDHVGNLPLFKNAKILFSETEWKNALERPDEWDCIASCEYIKHQCDYGFVKEGDFLTSEIRVMELPGHTLGLIGLKCGEDIILCSDAIKNRYEMWEDIPLMSVDVKKSKASVKRIKEEAKIVYPGHDTMLTLEKPIHREPVPFQIRFANGQIKNV